MCVVEESVVLLMQATTGFFFFFFFTQSMDGYGTVNSGQWLGIYFQDTVLFPCASAPVKRFAQCVLLDLT